MARCPQCGNETNANFCERCGAPVPQQQQNQQYQNQQYQNQQYQNQQYQNQQYQNQQQQNQQYQNQQRYSGAQPSFIQKLTSVKYGSWDIGSQLKVRCSSNIFLAFAIILSCQALFTLIYLFMPYTTMFMTVVGASWVGVFESILLLGSSALGVTTAWIMFANGKNGGSPFFKGSITMYFSNVIVTAVRAFILMIGYIIFISKISEEASGQDYIGLLQVGIFIVIIYYVAEIVFGVFKILFSLSVKKSLQYGSAQPAKTKLIAIFYIIEAGMLVLSILAVFIAFCIGSSKIEYFGVVGGVVFFIMLINLTAAAIRVFMFLNVFHYQGILNSSGARGGQNNMGNSVPNNYGQNNYR